MCADERRGLDREVAYEDRAVQLLADHVLPEFLDELAVPVSLVLRDLEADARRDGQQLLDGGLPVGAGRDDLLAQRLRQRRVHLECGPLAREVVGGTVRHGRGLGAERRLRNLLHQFADHDGGVVVGAVGLIGLEHRELR